MKEKVKELLSLIKGGKPCYFIQYTVQDGEIIILDGHKSYPTDGGKHPDLIWGDALSELRPNEEVIAKFEKDGINWDRAQEIREKLLRVVINVLTKVKQQKDNKCAHF